MSNDNGDDGTHRLTHGELVRSQAGGHIVYTAGETFDATEAELAAFGDRIELANDDEGEGTDDADGETVTAPSGEDAAEPAPPPGQGDAQTDADDPEAQADIPDSDDYDEADFDDDVEPVSEPAPEDTGGGVDDDEAESEEGQESPPEDAVPADYDRYTVDEARTYARSEHLSPEEIDALIERERDGKDRTTLIQSLEDLRDERASDDETADGAEP